MVEGVVAFISPKGYGMAKLNDGRFAFLPASLLPKECKADDKIGLEITNGETNDRFKAIFISMRNDLVS